MSLKNCIFEINLLHRLIYPAGETKCLGCILGFVFFFSSMSLAKELTLKTYLNEVREANPTIHSSRLRAQALEHKVKPNSTLDDPFIAAGLDQISFGGSGSGSVTRYQLSQTIPFPGKLSTKANVAQKIADAAIDDTETASRSLTVIATQAFYRAYFNRQSLALNEQTRKYILGIVESTKSRYKTGEVSHHEWLLGKIELGVLDVEKLRLEREHKTLQAFLNELRNQQPDAPITFSEVTFHSNKKIEFDPRKLLAIQPELRSSEKLLESAQSNETAAMLAYTPDFILQGMAMQPRSAEMGANSNWGFMVGINLPLYFWRKQSEQLSAARADREAVDAEKKGLENRLNTEIVEAREQLNTARDVVTLYKNEIIPITEIAVKNSRTGYAARRLPLTQLISTLKIERIQHLELIAAQIDVEIALARFENLLSSPPLIKFAPVRPTVFGGGMGGSSEGMTAGTSGTVNMGSGMSGPTRRQPKPGTQNSESSGMGTM